MKPDIYQSPVDGSRNPGHVKGPVRISSVLRIWIEKGIYLPFLSHEDIGVRVIAHMSQPPAAFSRACLFSPNFFSSFPDFFIKLSICLGTAFLLGNQNPMEDRTIIFLQKLLDKAFLQIHVTDCQKDFLNFFQTIQDRQKV